MEVAPRPWLDGKWGKMLSVRHEDGGRNVHRAQVGRVGSRTTTKYKGEK